MIAGLLITGLDGDAASTIKPANFACTGLLLALALDEALDSCAESSADSPRTFAPARR
jgi:hypothetical protein